MAAGASRRMEGIKQLLPWKESNFLLETVKIVSATKTASVHMVLGANAEEIMNECNLRDTEVGLMINLDWSEGLGKSIAFGVKTLLERKPIPDGILICLADQPLLTTGYLNSVVAIFEQDVSKIVASNYRGSAGVPALFPKSLYPHLTRLDGDQGARNILHNKTHPIICLNAQEQLTDIDTKKEYQQLIQQSNLKNRE